MVNNLEKLAELASKSYTLDKLRLVELGHQKLFKVPEDVLKFKNIRLVFLEHNYIKKLPENFFHELKQLVWLELTHNQLEVLPKSIAHHEKLEHLLLRDNNIRFLPNELGLVPNLLILDIADNPLVYPSRNIVEKGTCAIMTYLGNEFLEEEKRERTGFLRVVSYSTESIFEKVVNVYEVDSYSESEEDENKSAGVKFAVVSYSTESISEKVVNVYEADSYSESEEDENKSAGVKFAEVKQNEKLDTAVGGKQNEKLDTAVGGKQNEKQDNHLGHTSGLSVKKTELPEKNQLDKLFQISPKMKVPNQAIFENKRTDDWLNKLRILLKDKERIFRQERNLQNYPIPSERPRRETGSPSTSTSEEHSRHPEYYDRSARGALASQLRHFLRDSDITPSPPNGTSKINLEKVFNDLLQQLKKLENDNEVKIKSTTSQREHAIKQLEVIAEIHKKLLMLISLNENDP